MTVQFVALALALLASGGMVGLLAGVFGVGGGTVVVPVLYGVFLWLGVPEEVRMPLCAGTSLALIIPTSLMPRIATICDPDHIRRGDLAIASPSSRDGMYP